MTSLAQNLWTVLLFTFVIFFSSGAKGGTEPEKQTLTWVMNVSPPFYQENTALGQKTLGDHIQRFLELELAEYKHETRTIRLSQLNELWQQNVSVCFSTMIYSDTPPLNHVQSIPNIVYEPHGLITRKDLKLNDLNPSKGVSLKSLLTNTNLIPGTISGRTFGPIIDNLLNQSGNPERYKQLERGDTVMLMKQLSMGEFDYSIEYQYVFDYFRKNTFYATGLTFVPIDEVKDSVILGAVGCTNNTWGQTVIGDINKAISRLLGNKEYQESVSLWLAAEDKQREYLDKYRRYLLNTSP